MCLCMCVCHKREESQRDRWEENSKQEGKEQLLLMTYIEKSFRRQDHYPTNETIQVFLLCVVAYILRAWLKMKQEEPRERKKSVGFELLSLSLKPSISQAEVSSSPCGPPSVLLPLGLWLKLNLVWLSDKSFAMIPKEGGNKRWNTKLTINV